MNKKIAIMQPYIFPYIGYFQLINAVDTFVFYDDVNFIKQGWINRNRILAQGKDIYFTVPLTKPSSFKKINEIYVNNNFEFWKKKFLKTLQQNYSKKPYFDETLLLIKDCLNIDKEHLNIAFLAINSIIKISNYLNIETKFIRSSSLYQNDNLKKEERIIDICRKEISNVYINPIGGKKLYNKEEFKKKGIDLYFLNPKAIKYSQSNKNFIPWLSIIDILMNNEKEEIKKQLNEYILE